MTLPANVINHGPGKPFIAGAALTKNMAVKLHTTEGQVVKCAAKTDQCIGFVQETVTAAGAAVTVVTRAGDIVWAIAGDTITLGAPVCPDDVTTGVDGSVRDATTADRPCGIAMGAAADTELFPVMISHGLVVVA